MKYTALLLAISLCGTTASLANPAFSLQSSEIAPGATLSEAQVFNGFGCHGKNISPSLSWQNPPEGTRSYALTVYDPDAPTGSGWWHWVVVNLPASTKGLPAGAATGKGLPAGALELRTDFGQPGYGGACPPPGHGMHRYQFTVWALSVDKLPLEASSSPAMAGFMIRQHALGHATLTGTYAR